MSVVSMTDVSVECISCYHFEFALAYRLIASKKWIVYDFLTDFW